MPKSVVLTCLSPEVKKMFGDEMGAIQDPEVRGVFAELVSVVADCPTGQAVGIEVKETETGARRTKRAPSAFNNFVRQCATGGQRSLKECAGLWNALSDEEKASYKTSP